MEFQPVTYTIDKIVSLLKAGRLALPEFQRDFVWTPAKVVDLLDSVSRGWPVGSLLLLKGPQPFEARQVEAAPPLRGDVDVFVLDGQQRITALYHAFSDVSEFSYFVDFKALLNGDADFIFWRRRGGPLDSPDTGDRAVQGIALVCEVADSELFFKWQSYIPSELAKKYLTLRETNLSGLKSKIYRLPVVELEHEIELEALARIFETINRTGVKLNAFDLMVAVLYPHHFHLRDQWDDALVRFPVLGEFEIDGVEILKLIGIWVRRRQRTEQKRVTVRGVRQGDVLAIPPQDVKRNWERAVQSYVAAIQFARSELGVFHNSVSPPGAMILAIAAFLDVEKETAVESSEVKKWYWQSVISQSYAQGANTRVVSDVDKLRDGMPVRESESLFDPLASLTEPARRNRILVNGIVSLLAINGAKDIVTGVPLVECSTRSIQWRSLDALVEGNIKPDDSASVSSLVFATEESFQKLAASVRSGKRPLDLIAEGSLESQLVHLDQGRPDWYRRATEISGELLSRAATEPGEVWNF